MDEYEEAILFTLAALDSRLDRLEYCLSGRPRQTEEKPKTLQERVQRIERGLQELAAKTELLNQVQALISKHKDLLSYDTQTGHITVESEPSVKDAPNLNITEKMALVVERAPVFATTASQLSALDDQQIASHEGFTKMIKLRPRIAEAEARHLEQALKISELRKRGGLLTARIKHIHLAGQGRCWIEWSKRYAKAEQTVRRAEFRLKQEEEEV